MNFTFTQGDTSASQTLTEEDHLYESHINELRVAANKLGASLPTTTTVGQDEDCEYYCDGTADDVQIQSAIDVVNTAGGGTVYIKEGTYDITATVNVTDNVHLVGSGINSTELKLADATEDNVVTLNSYCLVSDMKIHGNKDNQVNTGSSGSDAITMVDGADWAVFRNLLVVDASRHGCVVNENNEHIFFEYIEATNNNNGGVGIYGGSNVDIHFDHIWTHNNLNGDGVVAYNGTNQKTFYTNIYTYNNGNHGIHVGGDDVFMNNILCKDNTAQGVYLYNHDTSRMYRSVLSNIISSGCVNGFDIHTTKDTTLSSIVAYENDDDGISLQDADDITITSTVLKDNGNNGVRAISCNNFSFNGVRAYNTASGGTQAYGISIGGTSDYLIIVGCDLSGNATGATDGTGLSHESIASNLT